MKGSFTVELSIIFPVIVFILLIIMQFALFFSYRIFAVNAMNQSLMICLQERNSGQEPDEAVQSAAEYLERELTKTPIQIEAVQWEKEVGWLKEEYVVKISARYSFLTSLPWSAVQKTTRMNAMEFRNRVDFVWEKGRKYLEQGKNEK